MYEPCLTRENYIKDQRIRSTFTFYFILFFIGMKTKNMKIKAKYSNNSLLRHAENDTKKNSFLLFNLFLLKKKN